KAGEINVPTLAGPMQFAFPGSGENPGTTRRNAALSDPACMRALSYFDGASAARRIRIPILMTPALSDKSNPPPAQFAIANAIPEDKIEVENVTFIVGEEQKEETWVECPDCSYGIAVCPYCKGKWENGETATCDGCDGTGLVTTQENRTVRVYNGTPCKICGDVGTVDDGKHGGQRALCGECVGYGKSHSVGDIAPQEGGYNGDYGNYAFSEKEITEEITETCGVCNVTGKTTNPCTHCSYGEILCPTCNGAGGHFEFR
ncbi:MAG: acetylxylan esterase, partial [Lachnospiraceae bacterium]|nr:acetylxylan esterase [Lachnospiraceae bacterium]